MYKKDKDYISLYTKSVEQNVDDNVDCVVNGENKENNDPESVNKNYISLYTQSEPQDVDHVNDIISKSNNFTLGEVRQAMNNGLLDDILPIGGSVYRVNSSKDTNSSELFGTSVDESNEMQVKIHFDI